MLRIGDVRVAGRLGQDLLPGRAGVLAVRPEDLVAAPAGELEAKIVSTEFRGHDFTGFARMADGTDLVFTAPSGAAPGTSVRLAADPDRAVVFAE